MQFWVEFFFSISVQAVTRQSTLGRSIEITTGSSPNTTCGLQDLPLKINTLIFNVAAPADRTDFSKAEHTRRMTAMNAIRYFFGNPLFENCD